MNSTRELVTVAIVSAILSAVLVFCFTTLYYTHEAIDRGYAHCIINSYGDEEVVWNNSNRTNEYVPLKIETKEIGVRLLVPSSITIEIITNVTE